MIIMLNIIKSASAIIRKSTGEVYLGLRSKNLRTFPNFWVFPGGKIDEQLNENWMGTEKEVIDTIIRELYEEIGLVFGYDKIFEANDRKRDIDEIPYDMQLRSELIKNMSYIGKKDTPPFTKNVYSAAYYYIKSEIFDYIDPIVDGQELVEGQWIMPKTAIKHWIEGKILLPPPILHLLKKIDDENFVEISREETFLPVGFQTKIEIYPDIQIIPIASSTIKPFFNTNLIIIEGKNNYILIDPGANDEGKEHLKLILKNLNKIPIIFLTHHHYDHWEGVDIIEEFYPDTIIYAHEKTNSKIKTSLKKINVNDNFIFDIGDTKYHVVELLGHTNGHIGLLNDKNNVLISGDHIVGVGSTVLDHKNGSMIDYMATCEKIKQLPLELILPSHGPPIFDPKNLILKYIDHRKEREAEILRIINDGVTSIDDMLRLCYQDTPLDMLSFAKRNLILHINKLIIENKVKETILIQD